MAENIFDKSNVVVVGGAGFIGSYLCEELLKEARVICVDDLSTGLVVNIEHLLANPNFIFVKHDIVEPLDLETVPELERFKIKFQGIQEIYNLACPMSISRYDELRLAILKANSVGVRYTLEWAEKYRAKYLLTSSSSVYGRRLDATPVNESYVGGLNHLSARGAYDESKRFAETVATSYQQIKNIDIRIARLFRVYGSRLPLKDQQMLIDFVLSGLDNNDIMIYGDANFHTTLLYVTDAVSALIKLMRTAADPGPINIGGDQEITFRDVAEQVIKMLGSSSTIRFAEPLTFMAEHPVPDISLARNQLGWMPLVRLPDGLQHIIDYTIANRHRLGA